MPVKKPTQWDIDKAARMAIQRTSAHPNEPWYQLLLDVARERSPKEVADDAVQALVDRLLKSAGVEIIKDADHPGGTKLVNYTDDAHERVTHAILNSIITASDEPDPDTELCAGCKVPEPLCVCGDSTLQELVNDHHVEVEAPSEQEEPEDGPKPETTTVAVSPADELDAVDTTTVETVQDAASDCPDAYDHVEGLECGSCEWGKEEPRQQEQSTALVRTDQGIIIDENGEILNVETAYEAVGIAPPRRGLAAIETKDDLQEVGEKLVMLQAYAKSYAAHVVRELTRIGSAYAYLVNCYRPQMRTILTTEIPRWKADSKDGAVRAHKKGDLKQKFLELGAVRFKVAAIGGWSVVNRGEIRAQILEELGVADISELLTQAVRSKWGARLSLDFSESKVSELATTLAAATKKDYIPGTRKIPEMEIGKIGLSPAGKLAAFSFDEEVAKPVRGALTRVADNIGEFPNDGEGTDDSTES